MATSKSSGSADGFETGISTATTLRSDARTSMVDSAPGASVRSSTVYQMYRPSGAVNVSEPRTVPPICALIASS